MSDLPSTTSCQIITKVKSTKSVLACIRGGMSKFENYSAFIDMVIKLDEDDSLSINLNSPGGNCDIGFALCDAVMACKAEVDIYVTYPSYSMGAILALCGDTLTLNPDTFLMFHDYSGGSHGKGQEQLDHTENFRKVFKSRFNRICRPFLSDKESARMFKGEDLYVHWDDEDLETRLKRHYK